MELGVAEMNLFIMLSALGLAHSSHGERRRLSARWRQWHRAARSATCARSDPLDWNDEL